MTIEEPKYKVGQRVRYRNIHSTPDVSWKGKIVRSKIEFVGSQNESETTYLIQSSTPPVFCASMLEFWVTEEEIDWLAHEN